MDTWLRSAAVPLLAGPFLAISALLALAGVMKILEPTDTAGALRASHLPADDNLVRLLGIGELGVGVGAIVSGSPSWAIAVGVFYFGFAGFVVSALRRGSPISSCGCFGRPDTPPTVGHVVINTMAAVVAVAVAVAPVGPWVGLPGLDIATGVAFLLFSGATVYLLYALISVLPQRVRMPREATVRLSPTRSAVDE